MIRALLEIGAAAILAAAAAGTVAGGSAAAPNAQQSLPGAKFKGPLSGQL